MCLRHSKFFSATYSCDGELSESDAFSSFSEFEYSAKEEASELDSESEENKSKVLSLSMLSSSSSELLDDDSECLNRFACGSVC